MYLVGAQNWCPFRLEFVQLFQRKKLVKPTAHSLFMCHDKNEDEQRTKTFVPGFVFGFVLTHEQAISVCVISFDLGRTPNFV